MNLSDDYHALKAALDWQVELGVSDAIGDTPLNRYELAAKVDAPAKAVITAISAKSDVDPVAVAKAMAAEAADLAELQDAMAAFEHCDLKKGARNLVFCDGLAGAKVMIIGEAPGRNEDQQGKPFVGDAGQMLDKMLTAIGLSRTSPDSESAVYITNVLPWRPPENRDPSPAEIAMFKPFLERHIELAAPKVMIIMGNISCDALLGQRGITKLRGNWMTAMGLPTLPMFHPAYLLRQPQEKRAAWNDLLMIQARLRE
jgi:uracil-DNA glycosylase